ncbi:hypothetical protein DPMN_009011 [Dreissena polymorpha]|uniref:Uncharacterized protein n=1 Tax=Dreissena polymorpha TaxID=45954 RepID=A0A9D4N0D9_DREPO|nr:hypothetical protein DPMN_009011 [Dreissena polymorpha]
MQPSSTQPISMSEPKQAVCPAQANILTSTSPTSCSTTTNQHALARSNYFTKLY